MKTSRLFLLSGLTVLFLSCTASRKTPVYNTALDQMIENESFEIKIRSVNPQVTQAMAQVANSGILAPGNTMNRIDVSGAGFFIKVQGDTVSANLPYYGERQMGGGYNDDSGILFNSVPKNFEIVQDEIKKSYRVKFIVNESVETYSVIAEIATNATANVSILSSHRNRIGYTGTVVE